LEERRSLQRKLQTTEKDGKERQVDGAGRNGLLLASLLKCFDSGRFANQYRRKKLRWDFYVDDKYKDWLEEETLVQPR